ncbi:MAG: signal peptidase I [Candidatus Amoebophilus sp.]
MKLFSRNKAAESNKKKSPVREWFSALTFAILTAALIHWLVVEPSQVPTSSMEQTILAGDFILVSKLHYGARTPHTPLQIPLMHQTIRGTEIPSYLTWLQLPSYRLPGFSSVKRGDKVIFNCTTELDKPVDLRTYYIKRCVGLPGETIQIDNMQVYIDGELQLPPSQLQYRYYLKTAENLTERFFNKYNIKEYMAVREGFLIHTSSQTAETLKALPYIKSAEIIVSPKYFFNPSVYPHSRNLAWNEDNFGPITIPAKGMVININQETLEKYEKTIILYDTNQEAHVEDGKLWINGQETKSYTFKQNYYFVMGDNRHNSVDSRFWGFLPEDHLVGKAILVLGSIDAMKSGFGKIRWNRFFRSLNNL